MTTLYALEHSQYAEDNNLYPFHIGPLPDAIRSNFRDCISNLRADNKWQIIFAGTLEDCICQCEILFNQKLKKHPEWKGNRQ